MRRFACAMLVVVVVSAMAALPATSGCGGGGTGGNAGTGGIGLTGGAGGASGTGGGGGGPLSCGAPPAHFACYATRAEGDVCQEARTADAVSTVEFFCSGSDRVQMPGAGCPRSAQSLIGCCQAGSLANCYYVPALAQTEAAACAQLGGDWCSF